MSVDLTTREVNLNAVTHQLVGEMLDNLERLRDAKWRFAELTKVYRAEFPNDPGAAELAASGDYRRKQAVADAAWFQAEIQTEAAAITALCLWANGGQR